MYMHVPCTSTTLAPSSNSIWYHVPGAWYSSTVVVIDFTKHKHISMVEKKRLLFNDALDEKPVTCHLLFFLFVLF